MYTASSWFTVSEAQLIHNVNGDMQGVTHLKQWRSAEFLEHVAVKSSTPLDDFWWTHSCHESLLMKLRWIMWIVQIQENDPPFQKFGIAKVWVGIWAGPYVENFTEMRPQRRQYRDASGVEDWWELGSRYPLPMEPTRGPGERHELPSRVWVPARPQTHFQHFLSVTERFGWKDKKLSYRWQTARRV